MTSTSSARPTNNALQNMLRPIPTRALPLAACALALSLCANPHSMHAQQPGQRPSALPVTAPTTPAPQAPSPEVIQPAQSPANRADVTYGAGQLLVKANNASLNQVLREISRQTGMKITGGVTEERIFGDYGPASPSKVLSALLEGTSSNVLLIQSAANHGDGLPVELVLTPRHGGPTPPNPNAPSFDQGSNAGKSEQFRPIPPIGSAFNPQQSSAPVDTTQPATQPVAQPGPSSNSAPPDGTQRQSPNDVRTPQQIYEQLLRLRQQPAAPPNQ